MIPGTESSIFPSCRVTAPSSQGMEDKRSLPYSRQGCGFRCLGCFGICLHLNFELKAVSHVHWSKQQLPINLMSKRQEKKKINGYLVILAFIFFPFDRCYAEQSLWKLESLGILFCFPLCFLLLEIIRAFARFLRLLHVQIAFISFLHYWFCTDPDNVYFKFASIKPD